MISVLCVFCSLWLRLVMVFHAESLNKKSIFLGTLALFFSTVATVQLLFTFVLAVF